MNGTKELILGSPDEDKPPEYKYHKLVAIPAWADRILFVRNGIDGWPPRLPQELPVDEFVQQAKHLQAQKGGGEWDVLVYAAEAGAQPARRHPYGRDNPYEIFKRKPGSQGRIKKIADWSYMRWTYYTFVRERAA